MTYSESFPVVRGTVEIQPEGNNHIHVIWTCPVCDKKSIACNGKAQLTEIFANRCSGQLYLVQWEMTTNEKNKN